MGEPPFALAASSSSGLPVSYTSSDSSVALVTGELVTIIGAGNVTITALQSGDSIYHSATNVSRTLTVNALLNLSSTSGGSVTRSPDLPSYSAGAVVTLTATPIAGFGFIRWSGSEIGTSNPLTVLMNSNKNVTAVFAPLTVTVNIQGLGSVGKNPDRLLYSLGEQVILTPTPARWRAFAGWGDDRPDNPRAIVVGENNNYTAIFSPTTALETVTIGNVDRLAPVGMPAVLVDGAFILTNSVSVRGQCSVSLLTTFPSGTLLYTLDGSDPTFSARLFTQSFVARKTCQLRAIAYNADFSHSVESDPLEIVVLPTLTALSDGGGSVAIDPPAGAYFSDESARITATASPGWTFLQWLGDATGPFPVFDLNMTRNRSARAVFGTTLTATAVGGGTVVVHPVSTFYPYGTQVRLTAVPANGNYLAFWANAASGQTHNAISYQVNSANPTITAVFASIGSSQTNTLTVLSEGEGSIITSPPGHRFHRNTNVIVEARPHIGQRFIGWSGDETGVQNPLIVSMSSHKVIRATFTERPWVQSESPSSSQRPEDFRLTVQGRFNARLRIEGSTDLNVWEWLGMVTNEWGTVQFTDRTATNLGFRAYRAVAEQGSVE